MGNPQFNGQASTGFLSRDQSEIRLLHVDDSPDLCELVKINLERRNERFSVTTTTDPQSALTRLKTESIDCIVSAHQLRGMAGLEFLNAVRDAHPQIPFIMFTGRRRENVASEALDAGATDYLEKEVGPEQYKILANRVQNVVERARLEQACTRYLDAIETACEGISLLDPDGEFIFVNERYADLYGYTPRELIGEHWELLYRDEDVQQVRETVLPEIEETGRWRGETTGLRADGETFVEDHAVATTATGGLVCTVRELDRSARPR